MDGWKLLKILTGLICGLTLMGAVATQAVAASSVSGKTTGNKQTGGKGKKCGPSAQATKPNRHCRKRQAPKLTRAEAIWQARDIGRIEARRAVTVSEAIRTGRSSFDLVVTWTKHPPLGTQDCSLDVNVRKRHPRTFISGYGIAGCDPIKEHKDLEQRFQTGPGPKYCPSNVENSWDATVIEGKTYAEARAIAAEHGCEVRIMRQDDVDLVGTADFRYNRLNLEVEGPDRRVLRVTSVA